MEPRKTAKLQESRSEAQTSLPRQGDTATDQAFPPPNGQVVLRQACARRSAAFRHTSARTGFPATYCGHIDRESFTSLDASTAEVAATHSAAAAGALACRRDDVVLAGDEQGLTAAGLSAARQVDEARASRPASRKTATLSRKALVAAQILASLSLVGSVACFLVTLMKHG
jgi:hypothetical protein